MSRALVRRARVKRRSALLLPLTWLAVAWVACGLTRALGAQMPALLDGPGADSSLVRFLSDRVAREMKSLDVPGAVVTLVRDDRMVMNAAFGNASVSPLVAADANSTTFRIASVTKVFTALAVLRVAQSGRLPLHADARPLLEDIRIRGPIDGPLTPHQLLTHTAGFDEQLVGYLNPPGAPAEPLAAHLARALPARTRVAHDVPGYSNHGYAVAGFLVERAAGMPFATYVRDSIFRPLGMAATRFVLEPGDSVGIHLASEYRSSGERRVLRSSRPYPAGNLATTGADMGRFLVALGRALRGDSAAAISPSVARQLAGPVLTYHPQLPPMGYGMSGVPMRGRTVWMKGGAAPSHSAVIAVIPDLDVGVFIALNRQEPLLWDRVLPELVARLSDGGDVNGGNDPNEETPAPVAAGVDGSYLWTRASLASPEKVLGLATQLGVSSTPTGVQVDGLEEIAGVYASRDSLLFERADGRRLAFRRGADGRASHLFSVIQGQPVSFERIGFSRSTRVQLLALGAATILCLAAAAAALPRAGDGVKKPAWARAATVALPIAALATFVTALGLTREADALLQGPTTLLRLALGLGTVTAIAAVAQTAAAATLAWRAATWLSRTVFWAGAAGGGGLVWFLLSNNLVGRP